MLPGVPNGPFQPKKPQTTGPFGGMFNYSVRNGTAGLANSKNYNPCTNQRDITDVAGRIADLVNCYVIDSGKFVQYYLSLVIVAIILLAIMVIAAREALK